MNKDALLRLREQVRLRQLKAAVASVTLPEAEELVEQGGLTLKALTHEIHQITLAQAEEDSGEVSYNKEQQEFIDYLCTGYPVALTGPAGSGKTTAVKGGIRRLLKEGKIPPMGATSHGHLTTGSPGVVCCAFTNKAVENMKRVLPKELRSNCITIHKLLEFKPEYFEVFDEATGKMKKTMHFLPSRNADNPLPKDIKVIFIDEATMVAVDLWNMLADAIVYEVQIVLIGDIQQLPPVFGKPIFIYAMQHGIKKVELVEVHRQALESPIISLAHKILDGKQIPLPKLPDLNYSGEHGQLLVKPWKKKLSDTGALKLMGMFLPEMIDSGGYDPLNDVILCPFNKSFGCIELNKIVANHLVKVERQKLAELKEAGQDYEAQEEACVVHEIISGIEKKYFRVGEKVLHNKTEYYVTSIKRNPKYVGKPARLASTSMDYNGIESDPLKAFKDDAGNLLDKTVEDVDAILMSMNLGKSDDEKVSNAASHIVTVYSEALGIEETLETAGELNAVDLGYALTVHKSQGSEYRRVLFLTHESNANMLFRELIYTAVTRAREELVIVCPPNMFVQGINTQRLPGKTLADKIEAFDRACQLRKGQAAERPERMDLFVMQRVA